jgi:hypothetical protein
MQHAARSAAFEYRNREHPDDGAPDQLRLRSLDQLRKRGGEQALNDAAQSLRAFAIRTAG